jgi:hypothetical protein
MIAVSTPVISVVPAAVETGASRRGDRRSTSGSAASSPSMVVANPPSPHEPDSTT